MEKTIQWNPQKDEELRSKRGIGFEDVILLIQQGKILDILPNPSPQYAHQRMFVLEFKHYCYLVPFVESEHEIFLKTIFPSRKYSKKYLEN